MAKQKKPVKTDKTPKGNRLLDSFEAGPLAAKYNYKPWEEVFLEALAQVGNPTAAAKLAGVDRTTVFRRRKKDAEFAARYRNAMQEGVDALELEARRRALHGWEEPVFYQGVQIGVIRKYSDKLLEVLLKGRRRNVFGDKLKINQKTTITTVQQGREGLYADIAARLGRKEESN